MLLYQHNPLLYHKSPFKSSDENFWKFFCNKTPQKSETMLISVISYAKKRDIYNNHIRDTDRN